MTRKLFIGFIAVLAMSLWFVGCTTDPAPDEIPPVVTIDSPDQDDSYCEAFTVEGTARDTDPGLASVTLYVDGEEVDSVALTDAASYNFEFDVSASDFPALCGEVEVEVVAKDGESNEASEKVDVYLCNDTTDPVVTLTPATSDLYNEQCVDIDVDVVEDNYASYEYFLNGNLEGFGEGTLPTTLTYCCDDLEEGANTVTFEVTDYCGNVGVGTATITCGEVSCGVTITFPAEDECLCGEVTFTADADVRAMPDLAEVCFYFDGEDVPRFCDDTPPYEWTVNVNDTFEPETHVVYAVGVLDDGTECESAPVSWVKSCEPVVWFESVNIDHCNRTISVDVGVADDNVEPEKTFEFWAETCEGNWSHDQLNDFDSTVIFSFDTDECGYGEYEIFVTVYDGWCDGYVTTSTTVTLVDDCYGDLAFSDPTAIGVYGDTQATWPLAVTANDRLVMPELTVVDFFYDIAASVPPGEPDFGALCSAEDNSDGTWGCDFDSTDLPAVGGYYYFHVTSTDNAENTQWATPQMFWKSDMPAGMNLAEEHADGNYYDNGFATLPFTLNFTDDNLADDVTTYTVYWTFSDGSSYMTSVGETDAGTSAITHTFPALGDYTLEVYIVETTPVDGVTVTSETTPWTICLENDDPIASAFDLENLTFTGDEGPYCNQWTNPNDFLVSGILGASFAGADDDDTGDNCVSGCDYFTILFEHGTAADVLLTYTCDETSDEIDWSAFAAGDWTVTFTIFDKAGNTDSIVENVTKSDFPGVDVPDSWNNYFEGAWECFVDPIGVPVRFDDWLADDDNNSQIDSLVFEFIWDEDSSPSDVVCPYDWDVQEEVWDYTGPGYDLPWTYYTPDYGKHWVRIWACDQYGQWSVSAWVPTWTEDHCAPDWVGDICIDEIEGQGFDVCVPWDRNDVLSADNLDWCIDTTLYDREDPYDDHGIAAVHFMAFDVAEGYGGDADYWTDLYGSGFDGDGVSACTGELATIYGTGLCTNNSYNWDALSDWFGCCGFFYVYAIAEDNNGNFSAPSPPVVVFKYSEPTINFDDCYVAAVDASVDLSVTLVNECGGAAVDSVKYDWVFDDGEDATTYVPTVSHTWGTAGLYEVEVTVTVYDAEGIHTDTDMTCVSIGDDDEPVVTNLDIEVTPSNANYCNEGDKNAQYGVMYYTTSAADIGGILQGPGGADDWTVEVTLWSDVEGSIGDSLGLVAELNNPNCCENEADWEFTYNWDGKDRDYYWMRARVRDRSGNYMGESTPLDPDDDFYSIRLFHSDPPAIEVDCDYRDLNHLRFNVRYDCLTITDDATLSVDFKTQWDQTLWHECSTWQNDFCDEAGPNFDFDHEFDWSDTEDNIWLDYFESGDGYGCYQCGISGTDNPAAVRAVDEDGIYSDVILFDVCIEDVAEPCIEWQEPTCSVIDGDTDLVVWASDYPEHDRGEMPCISRVDFFANDFYVGSDDAGISVGDQELCGRVGPAYEFSIPALALSDFLDEMYGLDEEICGWGGEVELEARAYDCDGNQSGDLSITVCESNEPVVHDGADDCDWAFDDLTAVVDFTDFICDDNPLDYIWVDWDDGTDPQLVYWANAGAVSHTYAGVGCYDIAVQVYDWYSTAGRCCDGDSGGPWLDWSGVGSIFIDQAAPTVELTGWTPAHGETCVSEEPYDDVEIILGDFDDNSDGCFEGPGIDRVDFWLSDDDWENREFLGTDTDYSDGKWNVFWNPWNQEAKDIWVGVEIWDCAGNSAEFFMTAGVDPDDTYWFHKDLKPWYPLIDQHEVWALINPAGPIPFEGEADNDPSDVTNFSWFWPGDLCDDPSYTGATVNVNPAVLGATPGDYTLTMHAEDDSWDACGNVCGESNYDTSLLHLCADDEGPVITWDSDPGDPVETTTFDFCFSVDDCFYWDEGLVSVVSASGDTIFTFPFQSISQWNPAWDPYYTYVSPNGAEQFCYSFPTGTEDCSDWDDLGYNPFADGNDFDVVVDATDYDPNSPNTTTATETFTISDVLAPYVLDGGFWYGDDYDVTSPGNDELPLDGASIDFDYNGGNAVISVDVVDWHCSEIDSVVFVFEEPAGEWIYVDEDNVFGVDTTPGDGFTALLNLPTPQEVSYRVGVFIWDIHGNESVQYHVNFYVTGTLN